MKNKLLLIVGIVLLVSSSSFAQTIVTSNSSLGDDLERVEELKSDEILELSKAERVLVKAQVDLVAVKSKIAQQHNMNEESWMEWHSWNEIHGKYILHYFHPSQIIFSNDVNSTPEIK